MKRRALRIFGLVCFSSSLAPAADSNGAADHKGGAAAPPALSDQQIALSLQAPSTAGGNADQPTSLELPPPPPRRHGVVLEAELAALGFLGTLKNVSPLASTLHLQVGYEPWWWLMAFAESDLAFTSTRYTNPPPSPRGYGMLGFGGGLRTTVHVSERVALRAQASAGMMHADSDALRSYGYPDAEDYNLYFGGRAGVEWYQVNPHYALVLDGGVKRPTGFDRVRGGAELLWSGGVGIRYTF